MSETETIPLEKSNNTNDIIFIVFYVSIYTAVVVVHEFNRSKADETSIGISEKNNCKSNNYNMDKHMNKMAKWRRFKRSECREMEKERVKKAKRN